MFAVAGESVPGEVVFPAIWGQHVGAEGRHRRREDRGVRACDESRAAAESCGETAVCLLSLSLSSALFSLFASGWVSVERKGKAPRSCGSGETTECNLFYWKQERPPASDWQKSESSREYKNSNALREYQLEGVNWLLFNWYNTYVYIHTRTRPHVYLIVVQL